ncbi:hypothetical protein [Tsuneonella sp. HG222]
MLARYASVKPRKDWRDVPIPLIGPTQTGPKPQVATQRSINWYLVKPEREGDPWTLRGTPGLELLGTLPRTPIRGYHVHNGRLFAVAGARVYEVYANGSYREWGAISSVRGRVVMASLLNVIVIGDGAGFYALDLDASTLTAITDAPRGRFCVFFNQRILYQGENGQVFYSELNDATDIPGANFFTAESLPDEIVAITTTEDQIWLHGDESTEAWYDSGDVDNPFQRIGGGVVYSGCAHPYTALRLDNSVWWVEQDKEGQGIVRRSNGFTPMRVSTSAVERFVAGSTEITAYTYQEEGHTFYVLNSEAGTWAYDLKTQEWHERAWLNRETGAQERQRQEFHAFVYGSHVVGDYETGKVYRMGLDLFSDAGQEIRRVRTSAIYAAAGRWIEIGELWLDFAGGVGLDGSGQGTSPEVMLRAAPEGVAFGIERTESLGGIGEYDTQVRFYDFGTGRKWVFEVAVSDPVFTALSGAVARVSVGGR